jgi:hypothetical protein
MTLFGEAPISAAQKRIEPEAFFKIQLRLDAWYQPIGRRSAGGFTCASPGNIS